MSDLDFTAEPPKKRATFTPVRPSWLPWAFGGGCLVAVALLLITVALAVDFGLRGVVTKKGGSVYKGTPISRTEFRESASTPFLRNVQEAFGTPGTTSETNGSVTWVYYGITFDPATSHVDRAAVVTIHRNGISDISFLP